ncbi:hypothetical protein [Butyrivibrio sp. NC2002]|uniref:hypothetical protein n=1 Tax=Butyrivibrio sp. NC2002 TaxID=1410610 RepID=UPI000A923DFC|nr:hypothetical protein [Butyrivibrio sp. NC2002]
MRFHDVQDTRKAEVKKEQRNEAMRKMYDECLEKLSVLYKKERLATVSGVTFIL